MGEAVERALELLRDPGFVVSNLPGVTAVDANRVRIEYRRLGLRVFADWYRIESRDAPGSPGVEIVLEGERSRARMLFRPRRDSIEVETDYNGPRGFLVSGALRRAASALAREALAEALRRPAVPGGRASSAEDLSRKLADLAWTTALLSRSVLVDTRLTSAAEGVLPTIVEEVLSDTNALEGYPMVYVSGKAENGSFKLLFEDDKLVGAYVVVDGREYYGDLDALKRLRGITTIRVYGVLAPPSELTALHAGGATA